MESASVRDVLVQRAEHGIVLQQVRQRLGVGKIVDRDEFHIIAVQTRANDIPADAAEAVDSYFHCHFFSCFLMRGC